MNRTLCRGLAASLGLSILLALIVGCEAAARNDVLRVNGSRLMAHVTRAWCDALKNRPSPLNVELAEGGSTEAIQKLLQGEIDVATSSRRIRTDELVDARSRSLKIEENCVGFLIYAVLVHPSNPLSKLTTQQVSDIFSGHLKEWEKLDAKVTPGPIVRVYRRVKPGEYDHFFERVVKSDPVDANTVVCDKPEEIGQKVASDPKAIGYLLTGDLPVSGIRKVPVSRVADDKPGEPTVEAALAGEYPLLRPLYIYINRASPRPAAYFREFVLGDEGREIDKKNGMVPLPRRRGELDSVKFFEMLSW